MSSRSQRSRSVDMVPSPRSHEAGEADPDIPDIIAEKSSHNRNPIDDASEHIRLFARPRTVLTLILTLVAIFYVAVARQDPNRDYFGILEKFAEIRRSRRGSDVETLPRSGIIGNRPPPMDVSSLDPSEIYNWKPDGNQWQNNIFAGFKAACCMILVIASVSFPDGPFTRPHPLLWRLVLGLLIIYWSVLVFVLCLDYQQVRFILAWLYPKDLMPLKYGPETKLPWVKISFLDSPDYATDCSVTWENVSSRFDVFILCHFIGWAAKGLMIRNYTLCWIMSVFWEITELFFAFILPNFSECWWDAWLFDIILCNGVGIWIGIVACRHLEAKTYNWHYNWADLTNKERAKAYLYNMLSPKDWPIVKWEPFKTQKRYLVCIAMVLVNQVVELNAFVLKNIFEIPSPHVLNIYRLLFWALVCLPAVRQVYTFAIDEKVGRLGTYAWCGLGCAVTESLVGIKFGFFMTAPEAPWPGMKTAQVAFFWLIALAIFTTVSLKISRWIEVSNLTRVWSIAKKYNMVKNE